MANVRTTSKTCRRAADREYIATALGELSTRQKLQFGRDDDPLNRTILVHLQAESGLCVTVELDGTASVPDMHLLSWNIQPESTRQLNNATFGGNVNQHHRRKATYIAYGFDELITQLEKGFMMANDGSAYLS